MLVLIGIHGGKLSLMLASFFRSRYYEQGFIDGLRYLAKVSEDHPNVIQLEPGGINPRTRERLLKSAITPRFRQNLTENDHQMKSNRKIEKPTARSDDNDSSSGN